MIWQGSNDFEQIISLQVSMSICVGPPYPDEFLVLDVNVILSYVFKDDLSVLFQAYQ